MKTLFLAALLLISKFSYAESFPVGSFNCHSIDDGIENYSVTVSEISLGGESLALVEDVDHLRNIRTKGIATIKRFTNDPRQVRFFLVGATNYTREYMFKDGKLFKVGQKCE